MFERILVPTDGSDCATTAAERAAELAAALGATLHALYVVDSNVVVMSAPDVDSAIVRSSLEAEGEAAVADVAAAADARGVACETELREGVPFRAIVDYADDEDIDLVVMGTHGRSGLDRLLLGSVTEKVVRTAPVPVLTVREGAD